MSIRCTYSLQELEAKLEGMKAEVLEYKARLDMINDDVSRKDNKARELEVERDRLFLDIDIQASI